MTYLPTFWSGEDTLSLASKDDFFENVDVTLNYKKKIIRILSSINFTPKDYEI